MSPTNFLTLLVLASAGSYAFADTLPKEAQSLIDQHEKNVSVWKENYEGQVRSSAEKLTRDLKKVRDAYTKPGSLRQAMAIQAVIDKYALAARGINPAPTSLVGCQRASGESEVYLLTGSSGGGPVWGTDTYTTDSDLSTAAVHAGVLKDGETGVVKVTFLDGQPAYESSSRNGITTESWGTYPHSFKIERLPIKLETD